MNVQFFKLPRSPSDLSLIENMWTWMKSQLKDSKVTNMEKWKRNILKPLTQKMGDCQYLRCLRQCH
jgi:hypothetical protein